MGQSRRNLALYGVLLVAAAAAIVFGLNSIYGFLNSSTASTGSQRTATVTRGIVQSSVSASGNVGVASSASAGFATAGTLSAIDVSLGEHVKVGQVLAKVDPTSAENTLQSAQANLEQAQSALATAQSGLTAAQKASNASSLQQAELAVTSDDQQLASDRTTLATAKAQLLSDQQLGCPASSSSLGGSESSSGSSSTAASNDTSSSGGSSSTGTSSSGVSSGNGASSSSGTAGNGSTGISSSTAGSADQGSSGSSGNRNGVAALSVTGAPSGSSGSSASQTGTTGASGATTTTTTTPTSSASTGQVSSVGPTSATFGGSVNPAGLETSYWFEYGTTPTSLGSATAKFDAGSGSEAVPVSLTVSGLKANTNYLVELVASNSAGTTDGGLQLFKTGATTQSAATGSATVVGSTSATLSGTVSPSSLDTKYHFQYGTSATRLAYATPVLDAGSGSDVVSVTASVSGLKGGTTYYFRLVASNASGTSAGAEATLTTSAAAVPTVVSGSASSVLTTIATLNGSVNPNGSDTKYWFEYGTTSAYGSKTAVLDAGSGTSATQVSATVSGLKSNTEYLFRLVASNSFGTSSGIGQVAKTAESSCVSDAQTITTDEQALTRQAATVTQAKESLVQTQATIVSSETPSAATIASDEATVAQDEATVAADQKALSETTLTAPISGVVTALNASLGETVSGSGSSVSSAASAASSASSSSGSGLGSGSGSSGSGGDSSSSLVTIDSLNQLEIVAGFAEADATKIALGQPATITFPALPETEVAGKVVAVSSTSTVVSNVVTYNETIALINPPSEVKEGMTADVAVVNQTAAHALELPSSAITTTGTVSTVELLQNGKTTVTRVTTGLVGNSSTQILSGLKLGDVVVEPTVTITAATSSGSTATGLGGGFTGLGGGGGGGFGGGAFSRGG